MEAALLHGRRVAVSGHRDRGGDSMPVVDLLAELGVDATLVRGAPGPARCNRAVADGEALALTTAPGASACGRARATAEPAAHARVLELLWRDEAASPALQRWLVRVAAQPAENPLPRAAGWRRWPDGAGFGRRAAVVLVERNLGLDARARAAPLVNGACDAPVG